MAKYTPTGDQKNSDDKQLSLLTALESEMAERLRQIMKHNRLELVRLQAAYLKSFTEAKTNRFPDTNTLTDPI